jgi:hypothetical protein
MHVEAYQFVRRVLSAQAEGFRGHVVEVGSRDINGSVRPLFRGAASYVGVDLTYGPGVDVVADAMTFTPEVAPDIVVCCEVLEHDPTPAALVDRMQHWVSGAGLLIVTCATEPRAPHSSVDGAALRDGEYYGNVEWQVVRDVLRGSVVCKEVHPQGDLYFWQRRLGY